MSVTIHPDPQERAGGFAFLELPGGALVDDHVTVAVFETYGERWLALSEAEGTRVEIGNPNWQSDRYEFGPYAVHRHDGADWVRLGPEIVNKLEEYTPLRISVGPVTQDVAWPDDVPPRVGAAVLGELQALGRIKAFDDGDRLVGKVQTAVPEEDGPEAKIAPEEDTPVVVEEAENPRARKGSWLIPLLVLLALLFAALLIWFFYFQDDDPVLETPVDPGTQPVAAGDTCSFAALSSLSGGFEVVAQGIRECGQDVSADTALRLIEEAAKQDDPGALLLFGTLYDGTELDPRIENLVTLTFDDDPARAVEYYSRAVVAGAVDAPARLAATCARLSGSNATLAKGAYDDFCQ